VARILILEPDGVRELIRRVVARLGPEPLAPSAHARPHLRSPRRRRPRAGLGSHVREHRAVDPEFESLRALRYLVKPFGLRELEEAIQAVGAD
jgi:hypothetical protein